VEIFNAGPEPIALNRGQKVGQADNIDGLTLLPFDADLVNSIAKKQILSTRNKIETKQSGQFNKLCKHKVPVEYEKEYRALLSKHRKIFSVEKSNLGYCDTVLHKHFMKTEEPVYVNQFKIPEAHQSYLQDQVREWLKLGIIQPSRSRYNSRYFSCKKRRYSPSSTRLSLAQCQYLCQLVFDEGCPRMHLRNLYYLRPHFSILANGPIWHSQCRVWVNLNGR
jgi:hypothetical protein